MRRALPLLLLLGTSQLQATEPAGAGVITVDLLEGTISPPFPIVNVAASDSVVVRILPRTPRWKARIVAAGADKAEDYSLGADVVINFRNYDPSQKDEVKALRTQSDGVDQQYNAFYVRTDIRTIGLRITLPDANVLQDHTHKDHAPTRERYTKEYGISDEDLTRILRNTPFTVPIRAESKPFRLEFAAGFGFLGQADERYGLRPRTDTPDTADIVTLDKGDWAARLVAIAHYTHVKADWFAVSFGLGTDLPSTGLTAMLGPSIRLATLPIVDSLYLTGGIAYLPRQRLLQSYESTRTASATIDTKDLTGTRYGFGGFVALSFGFFGGASEFKAVYAGQKPAGTGE